MLPYVPDLDHPRPVDNAEVNPVALADRHMQLVRSVAPVVVGKDAEVAVALHRRLALGPAVRELRRSRRRVLPPLPTGVIQHHELQDDATDERRRQVPELAVHRAAESEVRKALVLSCSKMGRVARKSMLPPQEEGAGNLRDLCRPGEVQDLHRVMSVPAIVVQPQVPERKPGPMRGGCASQ